MTCAHVGYITLFLWGQRHPPEEFRDRINILSHHRCSHILLFDIFVVKFGVFGADPDRNNREFYLAARRTGLKLEVRLRRLVSRVTLRVGRRILADFDKSCGCCLGGGRDERWARKGWVTVMLRAIVGFARGDSGLVLTSGFGNKLHEICPTVAVLQQPDRLSITWSRTSVLLSWRKGRRQSRILHTMCDRLCLP